MDQAKKYLWQGLSSLDVPADDPVSVTHQSKVVRLVEPAGNLDEPLSSAPRSSARDWSALIERVRHAANHAREVEAQAQEQELRVRELLDYAREDIRNAAERVRAAEARTADVQSRADVLLKAADEKVKAAEERARIAEEWLSRVYDTVAREFGVEPGAKGGA
ncbi:hypothetical protein MKK64_03650 [Methylobacterium sp. E-025]|uniref:hypothetical protein n=1 Tax=Methylobacterium sp. E-025 TaxID=2836561 RepID=UPI001FBAB3D3|nr:hypothetical protein [Methylobacterium sp. E-025]MCJ2110306.1 hypothetical protein [Methylobacterium sp. E-025]